MLRPGHFDETHRNKSVLLLLQVQLCRDLGILMKLIETKSVMLLLQVQLCRDLGILMKLIETNLYYYCCRYSYVET